MSNPIEQSFGINLYLMRAFRLYPSENPTSSHTIQAYMFYVILFVPISALALLYLLLEKDLDMEKVKYNAAVLAEATCFTIKLLPIVTNRDQVKRCVEFLRSPFFLVVDVEHSIIMDGCVRVCRRNTIVLLVCMVVAGGIWLSKPLFWEGRHLPIDLWLPFDWTKNAVMYSCVYVLFVTEIACELLATTMIDPLIAGLAYHAATQIKILKLKLAHLHDQKPDLLFHEVKHIVGHHDTVLRFVKIYEECFSWVVFIQICASVFVICFSCLQLSQITEFGYYFFQLVMYLVSILAQIYFYCYYGNTLLDESSTLVNAACMSKWYSFETRTKKALIILMERAREPIKITAGKTITLSLVTFAMILRRSYSVLAVLKN